MSKIAVKVALCAQRICAQKFVTSVLVTSMVVAKTVGRGFSRDMKPPAKDGFNP
jgi:hypothetical protein